MSPRDGWEGQKLLGALAGLLCSLLGERAGEPLPGGVWVVWLGGEDREPGW